MIGLGLWGVTGALDIEAKKNNSCPQFILGTILSIVFKIRVQPIFQEVSY